MYNIVIWHLYTFRNDHHEKSSKYVTIQSCYCIIDYIPYAAHYISMACLFYNGKFVPLIKLDPFHLPIHLSPLATITLLSVNLFLFFVLFICSVFLIPHISDISCGIWHAIVTILLPQGLCTNSSFPYIFLSSPSKLLYSYHLQKWTQMYVSQDSRSSSPPNDQFRFNRHTFPWTLPS